MLRILQKMQCNRVMAPRIISCRRFRRGFASTELSDRMRCRDCRKCVDICSTQAIRLKRNKLSIDHDACIFAAPVWIFATKRLAAQPQLICAR